MIKKAVYAGTFDPITVGHVDIAERAALIFGEVVVAVALDNYKENLFSLDERVQLVKESLKHVPNISVDSFSGLLVDYCLKVDAKVIVRGLRAVADFEDDFKMVMMNRMLSEKIDTVFLMSSQKHLFISSSLIKEAAMVGGDISSLVPPLTEEAMFNKYGIKK
ncbi:MAG: pantetheine-phosphate adenylyltransferase [Bacillota bacterium]|jgi:pantetheine-phosphate adenylyltransferase